MRTYSGLLVLEDIFDNIPTDNTYISSLQRIVFEPNLLVVEEDCYTTLGRSDPVNYELEGKTELSTGQVISRNRIDALLSQGIYSISVRTTDSCISKGGVCSACFHASHPDQGVPVVNSRVTVYSDYVVTSDVVTAVAGQTVFNLSLSSEKYDKVFVFSEGTLLTTGVDYTISGSTLTKTVAIPEDNRNIMVRYIVRTRSPFLLWLSRTYSGSILGMRPISSQNLTVRPLLLNSLLEENRLQLVLDYVSGISSIPSNFIDYASSIRDKLEKALYLLAIYTIFSNVTP